MKVQIDNNKYLTGNYATVGNLENSIEMNKLPDEDIVFYPAYQILSNEIEDKVIVDEYVLKKREVEIPILDEEGNDTGEVQTVEEEYYEIEPVEKTVIRIEYYYKLDEIKKKEIEDLINTPIEPDPTPDLTELAKWTIVMQDVIDTLLFKE